MNRGGRASAAWRAGRPRPATLAILASLLWILGPLIGDADWLVTRDGTSIETDGPWRVKGRLVVFELPNGTLSSLRLSLVDLEASEKATAEAAEEPAEGAGQPPAAVFVITDKDVSHVRISAASEMPLTGSGEPEATGEDRDASPREAVEVLSWQDVTGEEGVVISGTARNTGDAVAAGLTLTVVLSDREGRVLATSNAQLGASALPSGQSVSFRAAFPGVFAFTAVRFAFQYQPLQTQTNPPEASSPSRDSGT